MPAKILVVDDQQQIRHVLRKAMERRGHEVDEAVNGKQAIQLIGERQYDLVIADIVMPEQDGLEVIMFLKKQRPDVPIISVSAPGNELFLKSAKSLGATRVFAKPFKLAEMSAAAEELIAQPQVN